jgi:hypothetical protein
MPESCYNEKYLAWSSGEGGGGIPLLDIAYASAPNTIDGTAFWTAMNQGFAKVPCRRGRAAGPYTVHTGGGESGPTD